VVAFLLLAVFKII